MYRKDCMMYCTSTKMVKRYSKTFPSHRKVTRRQFTLQFTSNDTDQCQNGYSNFLTPYREQPGPTRIVVVYLRPETKSTDHAPLKIDQQAHVSQGLTSHRDRCNCNTEVHGGVGIQLVKLACKPASSFPKLCASLEIALRILTVCRSL